MMLQRLKDNEGLMINFIEQNWQLPYPLIRSSMDLDKVVDDNMKSTKDFFWSASEAPDFLARLFYSGFLPIASPLTPGGEIHILLPKLHKARCVIPSLQQKYGAGFAPSRNTKKKASKFLFSIDKSFDEVLQGCIEQHGMNWIGLVADAFKALREARNPKCTLHSIEVWDAETGALVAGEIGWSCGAVYTSATGFSRQSSAGTVQLKVLPIVLARAGFDLWDLGMGMKYKYELGAEDLPRSEFVALFRKLRDADCRLECGKSSAKDVACGPVKPHPVEKQKKRKDGNVDDGDDENRDHDDDDDDDDDGAQEEEQEHVRENDVTRAKEVQQHCQQASEGDVALAHGQQAHAEGVLGTPPSRD